MRKALKTSILFIAILIGFWLTSFFLSWPIKAPKSVYLDAIGLSQLQKFEHTDAIFLSFGHSSGYDNKFQKSPQLDTTLFEILKLVAQYPQTDYLINLDRQSLKEIHQLALRITEIPFHKRQNLYIYGNQNKTIGYVETNFPSIQFLKILENKSCAPLYLILGWSGFLPPTCQETTYILNQNNTGYIWGWESKFIQKLKTANSRIFITSDYFFSNLSASQVRTRIQNNSD